MKIVDLALYSPETTSGVRTYIENKIRYVKRQAGNVEHVVMVPSSREQVQMDGHSKIIHVRGVPTFYPKLRLVANIWKAASLIEQESPDVIEVNCQFSLPWAAFLATRKRRVPVVGVYHTDVPECAGAMVNHWGSTIASAFRALARFYEGIIYRHFTRTIIFHAAMAGTLARLGVRQTECIPCGVEVETFSPAKRDPHIHEKLGIRRDRKILLYVGRLSPEKEIQVLLDAQSHLPAEKYAVIIVGDGPEKEAIIRKAASNSDLVYLGHIDRPEELATVYASSDVFVMPGRYETFGMATLEALACGLPVVGIEGCGTGTIITTQTGALAHAGDPADLAAKIVKVASWPRDEARAACRSIAADKYSWDSVFDNYFALYRRLIAEGEPVQARAS